MKFPFRPWVLQPKKSLSVIAKLSLSFFSFGLCFVPISVIGAEKIILNISVLEFTVTRESLEKFASDGEIEGSLRTFLSRLSPEQREQFRELLNTSADLSPVAVAQFFYSTQGEAVLTQAGELLKTEAGQSGFYALRAAMIKAAASEEGLTLLAMIREFPTPGIRINSTRGFELINELNTTIRQTAQVTELVKQQSLSEITATFPIPEFAQLPNILESGGVNFRRETLNINDLSRQRSFPVDLYLPQVSGQANLVVISHGLGSDRATFAYLARHLASYGFAVAVPEHPGSSARQVEALTQGLAQEVTPPRELLDRPADITFLLDTLERSPYSQQINLEEVGIVGQSFGAYTALALAGAEIDFENLREICQPFEDPFNLSLLLQCEALRLPSFNYNLRDERIQSAIAINPLTSVIFGESELAAIKIPIMLVSGSADTVTPAFPEQIIPFTWLTTPNKYLVLLEGGTHFSALAEEEGSVPLPPQLLGMGGDIAQDYMKALNVAFFKTHISQSPEYRNYLNAPYAQVISQEQLPLFLIESLPLERLR